MPHNIELTNGSAHLLRNILNVPDALTTLKDKFAAGVLLCGPLETLPEAPKHDNSAEGAVVAALTQGWIRHKLPTIELTNAQHEACKTAVNKCMEKLPAGFATNHLITALGLEPE